MVNLGRSSSSNAQTVFDDLEVGALVAAADVIGLADATLCEDGADGRAVVGDEEPVADLLAVSIYRERLARRAR